MALSNSQIFLGTDTNFGNLSNPTENLFLQFEMAPEQTPIADLSANMVRSEENTFIEGVNYGNRFIPEPWMATNKDSIYKKKYGPEVEKPANITEVSFCDVTDDRILKYLDDMVKEEHFQKMQSWGVKVVRLPTGYWNWIRLGQDITPNAPRDVAARFKNLQRVTPEQYSPYINNIFEWAKKYGIKVFVEMHGAPGSQNSAPHSGCITAAEVKPGSKPEHYFTTDFNKQLSLQTVAKMAKKCKEYADSCYGVGVLNEPQPGVPQPTNWELHNFLNVYYGEAILEARKYLDPSIPVVLFSWVYDFAKWKDNHYPESKYGRVLWDTHLYTPAAASVDEALQNYEKGLRKIEKFQKRQNQAVLVGEFALSNLQLPKDEAHKDEWQRYADSVFPKLKRVCTSWRNSLEL